MSRAGRQARMQRLIAAGQWQATETEDERAVRIRAERDAWIREHGLDGWQREQNRRRAGRNARRRAERIARNRRENAMSTPAEVIDASGYEPRNDGVECETWTGLVTIPHRRRRQRVTIWRHPDVWPVEDCSRRPGTCCGVIAGPCCAVRHKQGLELALPVWRVMSPFRAGPWCPDDVPGYYRAIINGAPVMQRYVHPHDLPGSRWNDGWEAVPPCGCGEAS